MKNVEGILKILEKYFKNFETPTVRSTSDETKDPFKVLISCLLSLRTQDKNTEKASSQLFAVAQTPEEILKLSDKELRQLIFSSGHYIKKAATLKHVSKDKGVQVQRKALAK